MKFSLSKTKYSGGAIYLRYIAASIILTIQYGNVIAEPLSLDEDLNLLNEASWRIVAQNEIIEAKAESFIKDENKYGESVRKVIGKAIADCVTNMGEFANKKKEDTVTFETTPDDIEYSAENWNAVVLWNYLHVIKWHFIVEEKLNTLMLPEWDPFEVVKEKVMEHYGKMYSIVNLEDKVDKAISDIKEYAQELHLPHWIKEFVFIREDIRKKEGIREDDLVTPVLAAGCIFCDWHSDFISCRAYAPVSDTMNINIVDNEGQSYRIGYSITLDTKYEECFLRYKIDYVVAIGNGAEKSLEQDKDGYTIPSIEEKMAKIFEGIALREYK
ncbi:MAG: hypothetical protein IJS10_00775 [Alphaproteobacteria bacterium]|nr:hypothetical protein [Alphaproteobacteria bacterium]